MCGRYSLTTPKDKLLDYFRLAQGPELEKRYNIAPSQRVAAIRLKEGIRQLVPLHWGLIPFWAKDKNIGYRTINARAETADKTPAFRAAFRTHRCLIPASGFYEWDKKSGTKQPYYLHRANGAPLALAGLWEHWQGEDGKEVIESCTILTTDANKMVSTLHTRMPVIIEPEDFDRWLDPEIQSRDELAYLLHPAEKDLLAMYPVSRYVNKADHEGPECVEPLKEQ